MKDQSRAKSLIKQLENGSRELDWLLNYQAFVHEVETGKYIRLTNSSGAEGMPMLSPDRQELVFTSEDVIVQSIHDHALTRITSGLRCIMPRWFIDGNKIAFLASTLEQDATNSSTDYSGGNQSQMDLYTVSRSGQDLRNVTDTTRASEFSFDVSHDGKSVVYLAKNDNDDVVLSVVHLSGTQFEDISYTVPGASPRCVAWSDSAGEVVIDSTVEGKTFFFQIDVATGAMRELLALEHYRGNLFDIAPKTGAIAIEAAYEGAQREGDSGVAFFEIPGYAPVWSHDSSLITYVSDYVPANLLSELERGNVPQLVDSLFVIKADGGIEYGVDHFREYYPVAKEIVNASTGEKTIVNLTKSEAITLLRSRKSLSTIAPELLDQKWEK